MMMKDKHTILYLKLTKITCKIYYPSEKIKAFPSMNASILRYKWNVSVNS